MSLDQSKVLQARQVICDTAKGALASSLSPLDGARTIARHRVDARLEDDPDILPFVGIASETETLPIGSERAHWQLDALASLQSKIDEADDWARTFAVPHCHSLLARSERLLQWPESELGR